MIKFSKYNSSKPQEIDNYLIILCSSNYFEVFKYCNTVIRINN